MTNEITHIRIYMKEKRNYLYSKADSHLCMCVYVRAQVYVRAHVFVCVCVDV